MSSSTPDRILIEPSGVGKLSDVIVAVENTVRDEPDMKLNCFVTVADATKVKVYMKNFGEFYNNQIESAGTIILSRTQKLSSGEAGGRRGSAAREESHRRHPHHPVGPAGRQDLARPLMEKVSLADELLARMQAEHEAEEAEHHHHHHDHDDHDDHDEHHHHHDHDEDEGHCCCGHHHDDDDDEHEHHHHEGCCHHDHEEHDHHHDHDEHEHHHHHDGECDDPECSCHHHHHHADEVFTSWGAETVHSYTEEDIRRILTALDTGDYGAILRAKGIVPQRTASGCTSTMSLRSRTSATAAPTTPAACASSAPS